MGDQYVLFWQTIVVCMDVLYIDYYFCALVLLFHWNDYAY